MCPGISLGTPGACPLCRMELLATPTVKIWICPLHPIASIPDSPAAARDSASGSLACTLCSRPLVPVTMARVFRCEEHPEKRGAMGGSCPLCGGLFSEGNEPLPHGDHNPRHGGQFFMAPDQWHHVEGTRPTPDHFRVYLYDNFTRPIDATPFRAQVAAVDENGEEHDGNRITLAPQENGRFLEAKIAPRPNEAPLDLVLWLTLKDKPERFDFSFLAVTQEPIEQVTRSGPVQASKRIALSEIPSDPGAIVRAIVERNAAIEALAQRGEWSAVFRPALEAKELVIALSELAQTLDSDRRRRVEWAARALTKSAWLLEAAADRGNAAEARAELGRFREAVAVVEALGLSAPENREDQR